MYLTMFLHRAAQLHAQRMAVKYGSRQFTFHQMRGRVARLAGALRALNMQDGDRVAMLSLNSDRFLEYQMAVLWAGGVLNPCNTRWSIAENRYALEDSGSHILLVDETFKDVVTALKRDCTVLREVIYAGDGETPDDMHDYEALIAETAPVMDALRNGEDLAGIFYTGGTTGFPKGVMLSHNNLMASALSTHSEGLATEGGICLHVAPMFHLGDMSMSNAQWVAGNSHVILSGFDPEEVLDTIERDRVTHMMMVPTMIQMLVDHPAMKIPRNLSSLQTIAYGASPISEAVLMRAMATLPKVEFVQAYGMTELSSVATINPGYNHTEHGRKLGRLRSAGRATFCAEVRVVDAGDLEVPRGTVGEVVVRGAGVMQGYWNKPEETALAIRDGWMHTGDGGYMDDEGYIFIADRLKDMIVSGGENIYSAEVENALGQHPSVATCAVIGVPDDRWGESVHAFVVRKSGHESSAEVLIAHCKSLIAAYKCPRSLDFIDALPMSGTGKVLKVELRGPFWKGRDRNVA